MSSPVQGTLFYLILTRGLGGRFCYVVIMYYFIGEKLRIKSFVPEGESQDMSLGL